MPDFRGDIRRAIFAKVRDTSVDIMQDAISITNILNEYSKRYKDFSQLEKLNVELTVPIQLPPNGKNGDCKSVILEVQKSFNELGGGSQIYHALGSWLVDENKVVSDHCVVVYTAMPIDKWFECIPVLQRLIRDEIQTKLFQECVFLRIDNQTFDNPLNLLGKSRTDKFPSIDEFGNIDPACMTMMSEYEEHLIQTVVKQRADGDGNTQIAGEDVTTAIGEGAMAAKGDIHVHKHGIDPKDYAKALAEKQILEEKLSKLEQETDEDQKEQIAREATKLAEELLKNKSIEFDAWKLLELGNAAELAGQLERAEGYFKQAQRKFLSSDDRKGGADSLNNLGRIAFRRGDLAEAERLYRESLAIRREIGNRQGEAGSLGNLGNIAQTRGDRAEAKRLYRESLAITREIGDRQSEAALLGNLGIIARTRGDLAEAERLHRESLAITREIGDRQVEANSLGNLGNIVRARGDLVEAERLQRESLAIRREIGDRQGEAASLNNLGNIAETRGDLVEAERLYRESLAIRREIGNRQGEADSLNNLGVIAKKRGDLAEAERLYRESLAIRREIGNRQGEAISLGNLGNIARTRGDEDAANLLFLEADEIRREMGLAVEGEE